MTTAATPPLDEQSWLDTSPSGRWVARIVLAVALGLAWYVKSSGIRQPGVVSHEGLRWVLGWLPSFLSGIGLPYLWPALGLQLSRGELFLRSPLAIFQRPPFVAECVFAALFLISGEIFDGLFPQIGNTTRQIFDPMDIAASVCGPVVAWGLFRLLRPRTA